MSWNKPGDSDPWGGKNNGSGPPDLDEVFKKFQEQLSGLFGSGKSGGSGKDGGTSGSGFNGLVAVVIGAIVLGVWLATGFYKINEGETGVILRFGAYQDVAASGLHWRIPTPVDDVVVVNTGKIQNVRVGYGGGRRGAADDSLMLTEDENIVDVKFALQYRIADPKAYVFNDSHPDLTLAQVATSAIREVVGKSKMNFVLTTGRDAVSSEVQTSVQGILDYYKTGLVLTSVNMQDAQPPEQVQAAFSDAVKAREDYQRIINEAEAYQNDVIPKARGEAARMMANANAYGAQAVAKAEGETSRFTQILTEYQKAPEVTRERLYLEAMETVLGSSHKVFMDTAGSNNIMVLPLDRLGKSGTTAGAGSQAVSEIQDLFNNPRTGSSSRAGRARESR